MIVVARKTVFSQWIWLVVAILVELHGLILLIWIPWSSFQGGFSYLWLLPAAIVGLLGPFMFCLGLSDRR